MKPARDPWVDQIAPARVSALSARSTSDDMDRKLDWLQKVIVSVRQGKTLPPEIVTWLTCGIEQFINEGGDLGSRLGLKVRRGGRFRPVATLNTLRRRDELLVLLVSESPHRNIPDAVKSAAAYLAGRGPEPVKGFSSVVKRMIEQIPLRIPGEKQLSNIVASYTSRRK